MALMLGLSPSSMNSYGDKKYEFILATKGMKSNDGEEYEIISQLTDYEFIELMTSMNSYSKERYEITCKWVI